MGDNDWEISVVNNEYEINMKRPFMVRRIKTKRILKETVYCGSIAVLFGKHKRVRKEKLLAEQMLSHDDIFQYLVACDAPKTAILQRRREFTEKAMKILYADFDFDDFIIDDDEEEEL